MSSASTAPPRPAFPTLRPAIAPAAALALGLAIFAVAFMPEIGAALRVWQTSTAYGHCFLVLPIACYLAWQRRDRIAATPLVPLPAAVLLALPVGAVWLASERLGIMEGRQLATIALLDVMFLAVLGWRMWWAMSVPLLYLFFLVPFGAFLTGYLQDFTARFVAVGLEILNIPAYVDSVRIEIPEGNFVVAEACAGLRFLIASIAFGVLYAFVVYRSPRRRVAFIAASIIVPIIANGFRALGIVVLGHVIGSAKAAATDHVVYGWIFFSIVILLLIAAGMAFQQEPATAAPAPRAPVQPARPVAALRLAIVAVLAAVLASVGPVTARALDRRAGVAPAFAWPPLALPPGCTASVPAAMTITDDAAGAYAMSQRVTCGPRQLSVTIETLPPRANPAQLVQAQRRATGEAEAEDTTVHSLALPAAAPAVWQLTETTTPARLTASEVWIGGTPSQTGLRGRARQAAASVLGAARAPVLMAVGERLGDADVSDELRTESAAAIVAFLEAQHALPQAIAAVSALK